MSTKVGVSLPNDDVAFLDDYALAHARSRSAAVHEAIAALRQGALADAYAHRPSMSESEPARASYGRGRPATG